MSQPQPLSGKKPISRSMNNSNNLLVSQQRHSRQKLDSMNNSVVTQQQNTNRLSQQNTNRSSEQQSIKIQQQSRTQQLSNRSEQSNPLQQYKRTQQYKKTQPSRSNKSGSKEQQKEQKNLFYSQLHIETHDIDVPLVKILKVNQGLLKKFIYHSTSIQNLIRFLKIRSMNLGFRTLATNFIQSQRFNLKVTKLHQLLTKLIRRKIQLAVTKLFFIKNKHKIKGKSLIVLNRLIITKIHRNYLHFFKNCSEKKLINIVLSKADQDEMVRMKMNLEIFKQITFSKDFILKCRPLIKYNSNNKTFFDKELVKVNFEESLKIQLDRYEKIRQNVDSRNPANEIKQEQNTKQEHNKGTIKRKPTSSSFQPQFYQNQIVLMAIKSFNLSLIDTRVSYEQKITQLHEQITDLQTEERFIQLQQRLSSSDSSNKAYESVISEFYSRGDEEIRKIILQYPLEKNQLVLKKKLLPVLVSQKTKCLKSSQKHDKQFQSSQKAIDEYLGKLYKSRWFNLQICHQLINNQEKVNQFEVYKQVYEFVLKSMREVIEVYENQNKVKQIQEKVKKLRPLSDINQQSITIVVNLSECILNLHNRYKQEKEKIITKGNTKMITEGNTREEEYKISLSKEKQPPKSQQKIQRKTSTLNNSTSSKQLQSAKKQPLKVMKQPSKVIKQPQTNNKKTPLNQSPQQTHNLIGNNTLVEMIRKSIITYIKSINNNYQNSQLFTVDNTFLKKNLLPQTKGRTKIQENIQINSFLQQINSQLIVLVQHLNHSLTQISTAQLQNQQLIQMISLFYELILSSTSPTQQNSASSIQQNNKQSTALNHQKNYFTQINKKWTQFCKTKTNSQHQLQLINTFNQILMLFKQLSSHNNKQTKPQADFTQELKKILKQKLQFQRLYHETEKNFLIKEEEYKIVEKQNKDYLKKHMDLQKELNKLKNQSRIYSEKQSQYQQSIQRLKEQLNVYVSSAKEQAQENNKLNRELTKMKNQLISLNEQIERLKLRQAQRLKPTQGKNSLNNNKITYSSSEYLKMQSSYKMKLSQLQQSLTQLQSQKFQLNKSIIDFKSQLKDMERLNEEHKFDIHRLKQETQTQKSQYNKFIQLESVYQLQIQKLEFQKDQFKKIVAQLKQNIEGQKSDKFLIEKGEYWKLKEFQTNNARLQELIESLEAEISQLSKQIRNLQNQLTQKNKKVTQFESLNQSIKGKLTFQHQKELSRLQKYYQLQITDLQNRLHQQELSHESIVNELHQKYEQINSSLHTKKQPLVQSQVSTHKHTYEMRVLQYDPQRQIQSLKEFIDTLQKQNQKLSAKCKKLKKLLQADDTSTSISHKDTKGLHSVEFYQNLVHDLKVENDRLYGQVLKLKSMRRGQVVESSQNQDGEVNEFWLKEITTKQQTIEQLEKTINELNVKIQSNRQSEQTIRRELIYQKESSNLSQTKKIHSLQQQMNQLNQQFQSIQFHLEQELSLMMSKNASLHNQCELYKQEVIDLKSQLIQMKSCEEQETLKVHFNYSELLMSTKEVKELFTSFIQATNTILYKLDRTSEIYLNFEENLNQRRSSLINQEKRLENENQQAINRKNEDEAIQLQEQEKQIKLQQEREARCAESSIMSLVQEFKTVIQNNHETLKSIYQNLVCHPYTKTALQLQYLKQLSFSIISKFYLLSPADAPNLSYFESPLEPCVESGYEYMKLMGREQLAGQIENIFNTSSQERIKPIEEIFVRVEELIVHKIELSLQEYKKEMHLKAIELDHLRQKLNLLVDNSLLNQQLLVHKIPYHLHIVSNNYQNNQNIPTPPFNPFISHHNYSYQPSNHTSSQSIPSNESQHQNYQQHQHQNESPQQKQNKRPFSGNWISKTSSNYEYRPLTSLIDKYDLMEDKISDKIPEHEKVIMYRSHVNPYHTNHQHFSSHGLS